MSAEYNPKSNVIFGDVDLSDYNAFAIYCNIFDRPERDVEVVSVPGRNGDLIFDNGRYKNLDRVYTIQVTGVQNVHNLIAALTNTIGYQRLEDEYDDTVYMFARIKGKPRITQFVGNAVLMTLTFDRVPQKYLKSGWDYVQYDASGYHNPTPLISNVWDEQRYTWYRKYLHNDTNGTMYPNIEFTLPYQHDWVGWSRAHQSVLEVIIYITDNPSEIDGEYTLPSEYDMYIKINNVRNGYYYRADYSIIDLWYETYHVDSEKNNVFSDGNYKQPTGPYMSKNQMDSVVVYKGFPELTPGDNYIHWIVREMEGKGDGEHSSYQSQKWEIEDYPKIAPRWWIL